MSSVKIVSAIYKRIRKLFVKDNVIDVSVVIPFFNVEKYIAECMDSVLGQNGVRLEIIMVDDGSTDGSADIVKKYMIDNKNIRLYKSSHKGPGAARNIGVRRAKGKYIAFVDADDLLVKGIYRRMLKAAKFNNAEVCICNAARFDSRNKWCSDLHDKAFHDYRPVTHITETTSLIYDTCCWNKLIERSFYKRARLSFPEKMVYEDIIFNAKMHYRCNKVVMIVETGYLWRVREDSSNLSATQLFYSEKNVEDRLKVASWISDYFKRNKISEELGFAIQYKLLETDLRVALNAAQHMTYDEALQLFKKVDIFIDQNIEKRILSSLPVVDLQRYEYVRRGDVNNCKNLLKFKKEHYSKAPVIEINNQLIATLPSSLFTVDKRSLNDEFSHMNRRTYVDDIVANKDSIEVSAHLYIQRYNMSAEGNQEVRIFLVNEETNHVIELETECRRTDFLTKAYGEVHDEISGETSHYNYDHTGFSFVIDDELVKDINPKKNIKYTVVAKYKDRLFNGMQIIRWYNRDRKKELESKSLTTNGKKVRIKFGELDELTVIIQKVNEKKYK